MPSRRLAYRNACFNSLADRQVAAMARANANSSDQHLLDGARRLLRGRFHMDALISKDLQRQSTWNVLTELYVLEREGCIARVKHMIIATGEKPSTAVRLIDRLEEAGFIYRNPDDFDRRCINVRLTEKGWDTITGLLTRIFDTDDQTSDNGPVAFKPRRYSE